MTDTRDPYAEDDIEPVTKRGKKDALDALALEGPDEGDSTDRALSFQPFNDFGNAQRLIVRFGKDLIFVRNMGWLVWDGMRWSKEHGDTESIIRGHRVANAIIAEARALQEKPGKVKPERVARLFKHAESSGEMSSVSGMLRAAAPYLTKPVNILDADPFFVACPSADTKATDGSTLELGRHSEYRTARRSDYITRALGVPFRPDAQCPRFLRFLERVMPDEQMRAFLQRIFGYCLTGSTREQAFFIFYGTGNNGKSTLMNVIRHVMGDYSMNSPVSTFLAKREGTSGSDASPDLARLPGARLVTAAEPPEGARLDEAKVKEMASGEPMTARHLNQGFFEFRPVFKAIISTNHRPTIRGTDHGIWRRIRLVPFTVQIPRDEIDRELEGKLLEEASGILNWMLDGVEEWFDLGLSPPEGAIAAVESYRADEDPVGEFLKARCELAGKEWKDPSTGERPEVNAKALREAYLEWCKEEGLDPLGGKSFGSKLTARGIEKRKSNGKVFYLGIALIGDDSTWPASGT